ncbi:TPA: hypothetical protein ACYE22_003995 [Klebsiella pneumoniae]|uniref:hypothetical protein n=1 Tax=Klebsiella pneumoniae TaxID=573 RepID=UPI002ABA2556|nr:hypothetical protein [Klebsiella pneumoniae]MDY9959701.1 hypothetical protein [Klebsiella pneumoniae]MDY9976118.1 hypothetical protein [Klebsiella pneumoniae]MDY9998020.1 hypothetical protein [Klebsiella pneumoniae]MDZ0113405.1 hypothetical protein [Klebsiella pneumoniae]
MTITLQAVNELIQSLESAGELSIKETKVMALAKAVKQLAAENVALKKSAPAPFSKLMMEALDTYHSKADDVPELAMLSAYVKLRDGLKTLATDRFVAGIKADGVDEFAAKLRIPGNDQFFDALAKGVALAADDFAKQLREGDDK